MKATETCARIEDALQRSKDAWEDVSALAAEWDEWDADSRLHLEIEWSIQEGLLAQLADWHTRGKMRESQADRYHELLDLVAVQRPLLDRLFAEI